MGVWENSLNLVLMIALAYALLEKEDKHSAPLLWPKTNSGILRRDRMAGHKSLKQSREENAEKTSSFVSAEQRKPLLDDRAVCVT